MMEKTGVEILARYEKRSNDRVNLTPKKRAQVTRSVMFSDGNSFAMNWRSSGNLK
jgi:hypothetical protein